MGSMDTAWEPGFGLGDMRGMWGMDFHCQACMCVCVRTCVVRMVCVGEQIIGRGGRLVCQGVGGWVGGGECHINDTSCQGKTDRTTEIKQRRTKSRTITTNSTSKQRK